jgi:Tol biopolymer transport system component
MGRPVISDGHTGKPACPADGTASGAFSLRFVALALFALLALTLGGSAAAYDPYTGDIYVVSVAGGARHALTDAPEQEYFPALSPNGRRIAYVRDAEPDPQVWLMNADGSGQRQLTFSAGEKLRPVWSPDGKRLAFMVWNRSRCKPEIVLWCPSTDIWAVNADGSGERKLVGDAMQPAWSRDGRRLLFQDFEPYTPSTARALKVARANGSGARTIFRGAMEQAFRSPPAWSPNGKRIAFGTTTPALEHRVVVVNADGTGRRRLAAGLYAAWAPGGKTIALEQDSGVFVHPLARGRARRVAGRAGFGGSCPTWSPDGKRLALLTNANLSIVRPDGRRRKQLASSALCLLNMFPSPPAWSRDGKRIYFAG